MIAGRKVRLFIFCYEPNGGDFMNAAGLFLSFEYAPSNLKLGTITNKARYDNPTVAKGIGPGMLNPNEPRQITTRIGGVIRAPTSWRGD